jgi:hypothetical protein
VRVEGFEKQQQQVMISSWIESKPKEAINRNST